MSGQAQYGSVHFSASPQSSWKWSSDCNDLYVMVCCGVSCWHQHPACHRDLSHCPVNKTANRIQAFVRFVCIKIFRISLKCVPGPFWSIYLAVWQPSKYTIICQSRARIGPMLLVSSRYQPASDRYMIVVCLQGTNHCIHQFVLRIRFMIPYAVTRPQWVMIQTSLITDAGSHIDPGIVPMAT